MVKSVLTLRQRTTLRALQKLKETDVRHDSSWYGAFSAGCVVLVTGSTRGKVRNDFGELFDAGFIEKELNLLWRITEAGLEELENEDERGI